MIRKINFKKTWWILLLMALLILILAIISSSIDYALHHPDVAGDLLNQAFLDKYTYYDVLFVVHTSYVVILLFALAVCIWFMLCKLFEKFNK